MIELFLNRIARLLHIKRRAFVDIAKGKETQETISFAISACDEADQLRRLLDCIAPYCRPGDEIIVQTDSQKISAEVQEVIESHQSVIATHATFAFNHDFAQLKNHLNALCHGDWILQLDADECPSPYLMEHLRAILGANAETELIKLPRINRFVTDTNEPEQTHVAWPDYQGRLYRNIPQRICWHRPIHEKIQGHLSYTYLPKEDRYALLHTKNKEQDQRKWQTWKEHHQ